MTIIDDERLSWETKLLANAPSDPGAFDELFRTLWPVLVHRLVRETFCPEIAADIASETFASAVLRCHRFDPERGSARTWLWAIARNQLSTWVRRGVVEDRSRRQLGFFPEVDDVLDEVLDAATAEMWREALTAALATLTPETRRVVGLRVLNECTYEEIANELGCSEGAARTRFSRAISSLRGALGERHVTTAWP